MKRISIVVTISAICIALLVVVMHALSAQQTTLTFSQKLTASDTAVDTRFGSSIGSYGDILVVGANRDDELGRDAGAAYIFVKRPDGIWQELTKLTGSDTVVNDHFGHTVAIHDDTVIVGANIADGAAVESGAAYVFQRNHGGPDNWGEVKKLVATDGAYADRLGWSASIDNDTAIIGAWKEDGAGDNRGAVYIFQQNHGGTNNWGQVAKITASDPANRDFFGISVDISQDTIVVGARGPDTSSRPGKAYVFEQDPGNPTTWIETKKLTATNGAGNDHFGASVAIDGDTILIGAHNTDANGTDSGSVYIYERNYGGTNNWGEIIELTASDAQANDLFGNNVTLQGDVALIGARYGDGVVANSGAVYVFERNQGGPDNWGEVDKLIAPDGEPNDLFGGAADKGLVINPNEYIVSARLDDDACPANPNCDSGSVYIFSVPQVLTMTKSVTPSTALPGAPVTYTVSFRNSGSLTATNAVITDLVPAAITQPAFTSTIPLVVTGTIPDVWQVPCWLRVPAALSPLPGSSAPTWSRKPLSRTRPFLPPASIRPRLSAPRPF